MNQETTAHATGNCSFHKDPSSYHLLQYFNV